MQFVRVILDLLERHRRTFLAIIAAEAVYEAMKLVNPYLFKGIIDALVDSKGGAIEHVLMLSAAMFGLYIVIMATDLVLDRVILAFTYRVDYDVHSRASLHLFSLPIGFHERAQTGNTITRVSRGCDKLLELIINVFWQGAPTVLQIVITAAFMAVVDRDIALVFSVFVPVYLWLAIRQQQREHPHRRDRYRAYERASGYLGESMWNMLTIQSFSCERDRHAAFARERDAVVRAGRAQYIIGTRFNFAKDLTINLARAAVLVAATWKAWHGDASIGDVVLFLTLSEKAYISLFTFSQFFARIADAHEGVVRLHELLEEEPDVTDAAGAVAPTLHGNVTFEHVQFSYPTNARRAGTNGTVLSDVSFVIQPGETIAFAGPSGGGKSTIVKLLFRHYDVTKGAVRLDGHDVRALQRTSFRQQLGYVPQEGQLFSGTIAENIRFGKPDATDVEVSRAAALAGATEFIGALPDGYGTIIGEQGVHLSGGQRQRICIARAIVRGPKVLVFDEATSSLDIESERVIQESLERLRGTTTIILIAHRLSTIQHADRILVIEHGRVVEEGSHTQLLRQNGLYHRLVALQHA